MTDIERLRRELEQAGWKVKILHPSRRAAAAWRLRVAWRRLIGTVLLVPAGIRYRFLPWR